MRGKTATLVLAVALSGFAGGFAMHARGARQVRSDPPLSAEERVSLLAKGKELFLARCARCHGENGDKPLRTGVPLSERGLASDVITRAVKGRLADATGDEQRGVTLYIVSLMNSKDGEGKPAPKP